MKLILSSSPHAHAKNSVSSMMRDVIIALLPAAGCSVWFFGMRAVWLIAVCIAASVVTEAVCRIAMKRENSIGDFSAVLTGLLLALNLPATTPWWVVLIGAIFAIGVAKMTFGGLGQNLFNPAIAGRVFLLISFPTYMTDWTKPAGFIGNAITDAYTGATPLGIVAENGLNAIQNMDYMNMLFLNIGGSAGELSAIALLIGFVYLLVRNVIKPYITLSIWATVFVFSGIFWLINPVEFTDPVFNLLTGGLLLGSIFMATDYVTSPMRKWGGVVFGAGIGLLTMLIRYFGAYPEGMSFAILIMNSVVPLLNKWFHTKKYGRA